MLDAKLPNSCIAISELHIKKSLYYLSVEIFLCEFRKENIKLRQKEYMKIKSN